MKAEWQKAGGQVMSSLDLPETYDELSLIEKVAIRYWIEHAICKSTRYSKRTSYGIKHDFERDGFYLTNGQFKGAMLAAGYQPEDECELNWTFKIKPYKDDQRTSDDPSSFRMRQDEQTQQEFAHLIKLVNDSEKTAFLILIRHNHERDTHLYSLLAFDPEHATQLALEQFEREHMPDGVLDWEVMVLQPTFGNQPTHVARLNQR